MDKSEIVNKLRNRKPVNFYGFYRPNRKSFVKIQLNKKENNICFQLFESLNRKTWVLQNEFLSLRDVINISAKFKIPQLCE